MSDDLIRKIRGLLATAESLAESGHEEAAGAYIAKAHALQQKHSIDAALLDDAAAGNGSRPGPAVVTRTWAVPGPYGRRKVDLAHSVSRRTGCTGYFRSEAGAYQFTVFGFPQDVEWADSLFYSLCHQAEAALAVAANAPDRWEHGRSFATSFLAGFTSTVDRRLKDAAAEAEAAARAEQPAGTSVALVLAGKAARVESEMRASVPGLRSARSDGGTSSSGYRRGQSAGQRAALARGSVEGRHQPALGGR